MSLNAMEDPTRPEFIYTREDTRTLTGDLDRGERERIYNVYVTVDRSHIVERHSMKYAAEQGRTVEEVVRHAREYVLLGHEHNVPGFSDSRSYEVSDSDVRVVHVLTVDDDGYPVLVDPSEYR